MSPVVTEAVLRNALVEIANILGSGQCSVNGCEGCKYETAEARALAVDVLGYPSWEEFHAVEILGAKPPELPPYPVSIPRLGLSRTIAEPTGDTPATGDAPRAEPAEGEASPNLVGGVPVTDKTEGGQA